jgi:hypothetical protein
MYYPEQRYLMDSTTIRREQSLPPDAIGEVDVMEGAGVNLRDVVAKGVIPSRYLFMDAAHLLRLKPRDNLQDFMQVDVGQSVSEEVLLAEKRGRQVRAPVDGIIAAIEDGRILIQVEPEKVTIEAGVDGTVVELVSGRGAIIETFGGLAQGVWGNGRRVIGALKTEPAEGLEMIEGGDLDIGTRGSIVITRRPLYETGIEHGEYIGLGGIIAPSMDADLIPRTLRSKLAILLTEGFGPLTMSPLMWKLLDAANGRSALLEARQPDRWSAARPEVILNPVRSSNRAVRANPNTTLNVGSVVRLTRPPHAGEVARVTDLPKMPVLLENGLRVPCAQVEFPNGERRPVPLANIEVYGR